MKTDKQPDFSAAASFLATVADREYATILADPPWRFQNRTGKVAPEHRRLSRYDTLDLVEIKQIPVNQVAGAKSHLYLWVPNALLPEGLEVMKAWGYSYKSNLIWHKIRKDGGPDGRGVGFYFRNTTELILFGIRGSMRTLDPGRSQVNIIKTQKQEHSRKPDELYELIERCSPGPYLEIFARGKRKGWDVFGDQAEDYSIEWATYANHSQSKKESDIKQAELILEAPAGSYRDKAKKKIVKLSIKKH
jgi:N6-adenosine-specific RNA methylase IME4